MPALGCLQNSLHSLQLPDQKGPQAMQHRLSLLWPLLAPKPFHSSLYVILHSGWHVCNKNTEKRVHAAGIVMGASVKKRRQGSGIGAGARVYLPPPSSPIPILNPSHTNPLLEVQLPLASRASQPRSWSAPTGCYVCRCLRRQHPPSLLQGSPPQTHPWPAKWAASSCCPAKQCGPSLWSTL